jgi:hypothetical protein
MNPESEEGVSGAVINGPCQNVGIVTASKGKRSKIKRIFHAYAITVELSVFVLKT